MNTINPDPPSTCPNDRSPLLVERFASGWRAHCEQCQYRGEGWFYGITFGKSSAASAGH